MRPKPFFSRFFLIALMLCLLPCGCRTERQVATTAAQPAAISQELRNGPLTARLTLSSTQLTVADQLQLTLTVLAPEDYQVHFPELTAGIGGFTLSGVTVVPKELTDGVLRQGRTWLLSPYLPGEYDIPELKVSAADPQNPGEPVELTVPARSVTVTSYLAKDEKDPQLAEIFAPVAAPPALLPPMLLAGGGALLAAACALLFYLYRRHGLKKIPPAALPHEMALAEIDRLACDAQAHANHAAFYARLSLILRRYLESRFGLKAAEQTSEEFFAAMRRCPLFTADQQELLRSFLSRADLIKFARFTPDHGETSGSVELCRDFIRATCGAPDGQNWQSSGPEAAP